MWLVPLLVVVVAAAIVVPLVLVNGKDTADNPGPSSNPGASAPQTRSPSSGGAPGADVWAVPPDTAIGVAVINSYVTRDLLVVVTSDDIVAFAKDSGDERWRVEPPSGTAGSEQQFCGASSAVEQDRLAVTVGGDDGCRVVAAVDVTGGKIVWQKSLLPDGQDGGQILATPVEIVGPYVVVGIDNQVGAFTLARGTFQGWKLTLDHKASGSGGDDGCPVSDLLSAGDGRNVYLTDVCTVSSVAQFGVLDTRAKTVRGKEITTATLSARPETADLVSATPAVALVRTSKLRSGAYFVLRPDDKLVKIPAGSGEDALDVGFSTSSVPPGDYHRRWHAVSDGRTLVTMTQPTPGHANKLVAIDPTSGERRWATSLDGARIYTPIAVHDGNVLVAAGTEAGHGKLSLMRVEMASGKLVDTTQPNPNDPDLDDPGIELDDPNVGATTLFSSDHDRVFGVHVGVLGSGPIPAPTAFSFQLS